MSIRMSTVTKPSRPSVDELIECLDDSITDKAPCAGYVVGVGDDGKVAVKWADTVEVLDYDWSLAKWSPPACDTNGNVWTSYWCIERK